MFVREFYIVKSIEMLESGIGWSSLMWSSQSHKRANKPLCIQVTSLFTAGYEALSDIRHELVTAVPGH